MKIAFDCHLLYSSGIGTQTRGLLQGWAALAAKEKAIPQFEFIGNSPEMDRFPLLKSLGHLHPHDLPVHSWRWRYLYPRLTTVAGTHLLNYDVPAGRWKHPYVVTAHDLTPFVDPAFAPAGFHRRIYGYSIKKTLRRALRIMTPSQHSADDLTRIMGVPPDKISIVPNAVDTRWQRISDDAATDILERLNLPGRYFLSVGVNQPHKNYRWLIDAFRTWKGAGDYRLVIAGARPTVEFPIDGYIAENGGGNVINLGYLQHSSLIALYQRATALVFPSLYEGFGIPVIEAQKLGVPVLSSNAACMPDIAGDGALYFDPRDARSMHGALDKVLNDKTRMHLIDAGTRNEQRFSWEKSAELTSSVYEECFRDR